MVRKKDPQDAERRKSRRKIEKNGYIERKWL